MPAKINPLPNTGLYSVGTPGGVKAKAENQARLLNAIDHGRKSKQGKKKKKK